MRELLDSEITNIHGGFKVKFKLKVNFGTLLAGCCVGWITGGPVGLGYALCAGVAAQGFNEIKDLYIE